VANVLTRYEFVIDRHVSTTEEIPVIKYYITKIVVRRYNAVFSTVSSR